MHAVKEYRHELLEGDFVRPANVRVLRVNASRGCITDSRESKKFLSLDGNQTRVIEKSNYCQRDEFL